MYNLFKVQFLKRLYNLFFELTDDVEGYVLDQKVLVRHFWYQLAADMINKVAKRLILSLVCVLLLCVFFASLGDTLALQKNIVFC